MWSSKKVPSWVNDIIKSAVAEWTKGLGKTLAVQWVSAIGASDIRMSFRTDLPSWSCVGARARLYEESKPTMNFNFGGWKDSKAVCSQACLRQETGFSSVWPCPGPHAILSQWPLPCKAGELEKVCGSYYASMLESEKGCESLRDIQSIMRYDFPAALTSNSTDFLQGGRVVDNEALALVRSLYP
ncbi:hypothetical protein EDB81DRAFT_890160 [Dactylonectria macrodidyma]|uniref:Uncharacterized protein n=1 Tax=Dactylonectria macrodidyma TaxID=307937 RepID=A0A9P9IML2_9HYPO|nr:hypothetical protein EDB81DRAFT_890160 [Dactylonectria macrodidyma]